MTPRGAAPLIAMRQAGQRPSGFVWVSYGDFVEPDWWRWAETCHAPELLVRPGDPIERLDLRCLVGLDVILFFHAWTARVSQLYERVQDYAQEIAVQSPAFESDIGWWWVEGRGRIDFNERHLLTEFEAAQAACIAAATGRDAAAYKAAQARELDVLRRAPWLR